MPAPRTLLAAALLLAVLPLAAGAAGCSRGPVAEQPPARKSLTPAEKGEARARADIAAGKRRILRYGNPLAPGSRARDEESGLPVRNLIDCCVSAEAREETEAYNRAMRESAATARRGAR